MLILLNRIYVYISMLAGVDYDNTTLTVTFTAGSVIATVRISIVDDTHRENWCVRITHLSVLH